MGLAQTKKQIESTVRKLGLESSQFRELLGDEVTSILQFVKAYFAGEEENLYYWWDYFHLRFDTVSVLLGTKDPGLSKPNGFTETHQVVVQYYVELLAEILPSKESVWFFIADWPDPFAVYEGTVDAVQSILNECWRFLNEYYSFQGPQMAGVSRASPFS